MNAFDELRFGAGRILNLREGLPTAAVAVERAERWLREQQLHGAGEVLVITGRGLHSPGGIGVIRAEVGKLLFSLRRRGVVASHEEYNPGAFVVRLAPIRSLAEAMPRRREPPRAREAASLHGLSDETLSLLRQLAEVALHELGVTPDEATIDDEMHRQLRAFTPALGGDTDVDVALQAAVRAAIAEFD